MFRFARNFRILSIAILLLIASFQYKVEKVSAVADFDTITVNLSIGATISCVCVDPVNMGGITGTGQSALGTNSSTCTVITNNSAGYNLTWRASAATMADGLGDTIAAYTPAVADTPETWSVAAADSEWGGHLGSGSTTVDLAAWGAADTYAGGKWLNVKNIASFQIANRITETAAGGDSEIIYFGGEVGAGHFQPTGTYTVTVTVTATTN